MVLNYLNILSNRRHFVNRFFSGVKIAGPARAFESALEKATPASDLAVAA